MTATTPLVGIEKSAEIETQTAPSGVADGAIADEIRIVQSVQTQLNMPVLLLGNTAAVMIVLYTDWAASINSYGVYFLAAVLLLLLPVLRSYLA